jgi:hypothetical protein
MAAFQFRRTIVMALGQDAMGSPGALAWIASAWTPPANSAERIWLIMR